MDRVELGEVGPDRDGLVAVVGALLQPREELLAGPAPVGGAGEEQELLRVLQRERGADGVEVRELGDVLDALAAGRPGAGQDQLADELGLLQRDHLRDHAAHREAEDVDLLEAQGPDERDRVTRHGLDGVRGLAGRGADAAVVEGDHVVPGGDAVDDSRVPVVKDGGEVADQDYGDAAARAQLAVGEVDTACRDRLGGGVLVRAFRVASRRLIGSHGLPFGRKRRRCDVLYYDRTAIRSAGPASAGHTSGAMPNSASALRTPCSSRASERTRSVRARESWRVPTIAA